jgi:sugar (pentulose or hexulose) kinase
MRLQELTLAETALLTAPAAAPDDLQARLTRKLAATLSARLHLPVQAMAMSVDVPAAALASPVWQPDAALASLWLIRRLGGQHVMGTTSFVPHTLIHALDAALAECWLDAAAQASLPAALAWQLTATHTQATLAVQLPHTTTDMTRWARGVIRHG